MLEIKNIQKKIKEKIILKDISLSLKPGRIYGLLGNNGAGKTTLIKIIFQEYNFDSGSIKFNGLDIKNTDYKSWYFFSENNELPKNITVKTYLNMIKNMACLSKDIFLARSDELNKFIDLKPLLKNSIASLSAGQQKLLSLYVCLLLKPKIIFFDEPTANLDIENKNIVIHAIKKMKNQDTLIVVITHLVEEIKDILDHVVIMDDGVIKYNEKHANDKKNLKEIFQANVRLDSSKKNQMEEYINEI
ncbi:MAG: ATP-binding cassette domain-containing protein [Spiroplasma sp.]